jgi:hypothetical protein
VGVDLVEGVFKIVWVALFGHGSLLVIITLLPSRLSTPHAVVRIWPHA